MVRNQLELAHGALGRRGCFDPRTHEPQRGGATKAPADPRPIGHSYEDGGHLGPRLRLRWQRGRRLFALGLAADGRLLGDALGLLTRRRRCRLGCRRLGLGGGALGARELGGVSASLLLSAPLLLLVDDGGKEVDLELRVDDADGLLLDAFGLQLDHEELQLNASVPAREGCGRVV